MLLQPTSVSSPLESPLLRVENGSRWFRVRPDLHPVACIGIVADRPALLLPASATIATVNTGRTEFNTFRGQARQEITAVFVNKGNITQEEMDWSPLLDRFIDRSLNRIDIVTHELAVDCDRDGAWFIGRQNPNH